MSYKNEFKESAQDGTIFGVGFLTFSFFVLLILGVTGYLSYLAYSFYAPRYEQVRYNTFKQSQAYNDGMIRDLQNLKMEYIKANDEQKAALKAIVIHRFSVYDIDRLPTDLQIFYNSVSH
jgi:hypothetical protein